VKLILRNKEFEVKPGMTLLAALQKINVVPESVIATRDGEMILDDEILKDGDVVKLIAVISGGSCHCEGDTCTALRLVQCRCRTKQSSRYKEIAPRHPFRGASPSGRDGRSTGAVSSQPTLLATTGDDYEM
jgi:sulfur carrier protein ThiS